jgi:hypothetical protein
MFGVGYRQSCYLATAFVQAVFSKMRPAEIMLYASNLILGDQCKIVTARTGLMNQFSGVKSRLPIV